MKRFKKVYIEITNICNLSCDFCPKTKRITKIMSVEEFQKVIDEIKEYTDYVYFHLMGEPFVNKNIEQFLSICEKENLKVNITTNGTLIRDVKEKLLKSKALRQVNFSLHSFEANTKKDSEFFTKYLSDILEFVNEARINTNIISALRLWNYDGEITKGANELNESIIEYIKQKLLLDNIDIVEELKIKNGKGIKLCKNVYLNTAEKFQWPTMDIEPFSDKGFCYGLRDQIGILVDGTVVPCCLDGEANIPLGNINNESMKQILNSERAQNLFNGFSDRKAVEELCKRCGYRQRF